MKVEFWRRHIKALKNQELYFVVGMLSAEFDTRKMPDEVTLMPRKKK